jgi:hypothetical protein
MGEQAQNTFWNVPSFVSRKWMPRIESQFKCSLSSICLFECQVAERTTCVAYRWYVTRHTVTAGHFSSFFTPTENISGRPASRSRFGHSGRSHARHTAIRRWLDSSISIPPIVVQRHRFGATGKRNYSRRVSLQPYKVDEGLRHIRCSKFQAGSAKSIDKSHLEFLISSS